MVYLTASEKTRTSTVVYVASSVDSELLTRDGENLTIRHTIVHAL